MQSKENDFQKIISHAKEYGFVFPSSEIYDGLNAVYDYGWAGVELKRNLKESWWKAMTQLHDNIVGLDAAIFMHPTTWKASGHVDNFSDPLIDNKDSKKRYRLDHLIEGFAESLEQEGKTLLAQQIIQEMNLHLKNNDFDALSELIRQHNIKCAISGTCNWTAIRQFNLMFETEIGSVVDETNVLYLRPETAQGIFVNFLNVQKTARKKIPFGIAQIGKAFRNEIVARQFIFRMREFEQMEMQFFIKPGSQKYWYDYWKKTRYEWHLKLGIAAEKYRFHDHEKLAHYADAATDIEFAFPFGFKELEGIHSRTDYDLGRHQEFSKKKQTYFDPETQQHFIPYVIETSIGLDRLFLAVLSNAYTEEKMPKEDGQTEERVVLKMKASLAPFKLAIFPLTKKDGLPELAEKLYQQCRQKFTCFYEEKDSIGKRYRRQDALGTPFCVTIDHQTLTDQTVTIRDRDSMSQKRILLNEIESFILQQLD
ncbi:MAG: glycine--tRNA ligase [Sediminibacterium sp.]|nr:glycine--tRNA ligase [Sediminibacterium sp.]